jgi:peptide methionine sulfoxide reductase msrA/msrB
MILELIVAAGCFWGVEKTYDNIPGVIKAESGYAGGSYKNPTYKKVLKNRGNKSVINYAEVVKITYDNKIIDADKLIKTFWELHDPTQLNKQGNDVGSNYRSAIFYTTEKQRQIALKTKEEYQNLLSNNGYGEIKTTIQHLNKFYKAEKYHQDYLKNNPYGYCPDHTTGVKFKKQNKIIINNDVLPLGGKEILVIKSENYCPYCEKFEKEVTSKYKGNITLRTVFKKDLKDFDIKTNLFATPSIVFIQDGKEAFAHVGYMSPMDFYEALGIFKLKKGSSAYNVAFNKGTDAPGCKQYDIFKDTPDGVFVDKLSGEILFDTRDRFHSGTGWLSFYKSYKNNVIEKADNSLGMKRIEILAKTSGIHLGHVFPMPNNKRRFCLDATVLEFIPRDEVIK